MRSNSFVLIICSLASITGCTIGGPEGPSTTDGAVADGGSDAVVSDSGPIVDSAPPTDSGPVDSGSDAAVDTGPTCVPTWGQACQPGTGTCQRTGTVLCNGACSVSAGAPSPETCNGLDDNCDGTVDNGVAPQACYTGPGGTRMVGICHDGAQTCSGGMFGACTGQTLPAPTEICGNGLDDNCDGRVDEGCMSSACMYATWHVQFTMPAGQLARSMADWQYGDYTACSLGLVQPGCEEGHDAPLTSGTFSSEACAISFSAGRPAVFNASYTMPASPGSPEIPAQNFCHLGRDGTGLDVAIPGTPYYTYGTFTITSPTGHVCSWHPIDNTVGGCNIVPDDSCI